MNFDSYQREALGTDQVPTQNRADDALSLIVPMLGLAGETGQLLSEYKKHLRDDMGCERRRSKVAPPVADDARLADDAARARKESSLGDEGASSTASEGRARRLWRRHYFRRA